VGNQREVPLDRANQVSLADLAVIQVKLQLHVVAAACGNERSRLCIAVEIVSGRSRLLSGSKVLFAFLGCEIRALHGFEEQVVRGVFMRSW